jgi:hypothetical protein
MFYFYTVPYKSGIMSRAWVVLGVAVFVASCGGNDGALAPPSLPTQSPSGIWIGPFTSTVDASVSQTLGVVSRDNDVQLVAGAVSARHFAGNFSTDGDLLTGTLNVYLGRQGPFVGFDGIQSISVDGTVSENDGLFGDYSGDEDQGRFNLNYLGIYDNSSSLELTAGTWSFVGASASGPLYTVVFDIDINGNLFGSDSAGCIYSGRVSLIDEQFNAYAATFNVTDCLLSNGDYIGLAWISSIGGGQQNQLTLALTKGIRAFAAPFLKL